jgi:DNA-binding transcriptional LysR family regulator
VDDRISLHKLTVFETVVEFASVSRAAERLFVAQPVVTAHIRTLEEQVGVELFVRGKRRMELTEAGRTMHRWATDVLRRSHELSRELAGLADGTEGTIVISTSMSLGCYDLPPLLARFRMDRPGVTVKVEIQDSARAVAAVDHGDSDFAVIMTATSPSADGLDAERIGFCEMILVAAPDCDLPPSIAAAELATLAFVEGPSRAIVDRQLARQGIHERNIMIELGHPEAVKAVVGSGLGVALLPLSSVQVELERGDLRRIEIDETQVGLPIFIAHRGDKQLPQAQQDLADAIRVFLAGAAPARTS